MLHATAQQSRNVSPLQMLHFSMTLLIVCCTVALLQRKKGKIEISFDLIFEFIKSTNCSTQASQGRWLQFLPPPPPKNRERGGCFYRAPAGRAGQNVKLGGSYPGKFACLAGNRDPIVCFFFLNV